MAQIAATDKQIAAGSRRLHSTSRCTQHPMRRRSGMAAQLQTRVHCSALCATARSRAVPERLRVCGGLWGQTAPAASDGGSTDPPWRTLSAPLRRRCARASRQPSLPSHPSLRSHPSLPGHPRARRAVAVAEPGAARRRAVRGRGNTQMRPAREQLHQRCCPGPRPGILSGMPERSASGAGSTAPVGGAVGPRVRKVGDVGMESGECLGAPSQLMES